MKMSSIKEEIKETHVTDEGYCKVCNCILRRHDVNDIEEHITGKKHNRRIKQLQFKAPLVTYVDRKVANTNFKWEADFDFNLLSKDGIIVTDNKSNPVVCKCCECVLPPLSISKDANIYNTKVHVLGESHHMNFGVKKLSITDVASVFKMLEARVKSITQLQSLGFCSFQNNQQYILFAGKHKYHCKLCNIIIQMKLGNDSYYNVLVHLIGKNHTGAFKKLTPHDKIEYKSLVCIRNRSLLKRRKNIYFEETDSGHKIEFINDAVLAMTDMIKNCSI